MKFEYIGVIGLNKEETKEAQDIMFRVKGDNITHQICPHCGKEI